jgi:hypothetical protein
MLGRRRVGRPGLVGTAARTAVIAGTASTVSGNVARRQMSKAQARAAAATPPPAPAPESPPPAPAGAPAAEDRIAQLERLAALHAQGILTDEELAAEKARILG